MVSHLPNLRDSPSLVVLVDLPKQVGYVGHVATETSGTT